MKKILRLLMVMVMVMSVLTSVSFAGTYTVKSGDVLWKIAKDNGTDWKTLADYNKLSNPNLIMPGQVLNIPGEKVTEVEETKITLLHTNDMHGFFVEGKYDGMGAAKMATFVKSMKQQNPNTLFLDAGDAMQGNNLVTLSDGVNATKVMNALGYDVMVAGNHEFDYGKEQVLKNEALLNFPMLGANIKYDNGEAFLDSYVIEELNGVKVGIFGLSTPETMYKSHPKNSEGLKFEDPVATAKAMVAMLDGKVDVIVALAHLGDEGSATSIKVAEAVPAIDVIIDGHSHSEYAEGKMVNGVLIASAKEKTKNVGVIDLMVKDGEVTAKRAHLFSKTQAADLAEDAEMMALIEALKAENAVIEQEVVATSPVVLEGERADVRTGETNLGNLIAESLLDISGADVALTNGGGIRTSIDAGEVTKGEVLTVLPFGNTVAVIELTGADIVAALENGLAEYPEANGAFPHIAGMMVEFDSSKAVGERVVSAKIAGVEVDPAKTYTLCTNDFLAAGGDDYAMFDGKKVVAEFGAMDEVLIDYLNAVGFDKGALTGRIKDVNQ